MVIYINNNQRELAEEKKESECVKMPNTISKKSLMGKKNLNFIAVFKRTFLGNYAFVFIIH